MSRGGRQFCAKAFIKEVQYISIMEGRFVYLHLYRDRKNSWGVVDRDKIEALKAAILRWKKS